MIALGYPKYVAQGGDWGSLVTRRLGQLYPEHCKAIHVNLLFVLGTPKFSQGPLIWLKWVTLIGPLLLYDKREIEQLKNFQKFRKTETGYQVFLNSKNVKLMLHSSYKARNLRVFLMDCGIRL
jgi:pimeloyl-ACP methyl ester carboxylesterase